MLQNLWIIQVRQPQFYKLSRSIFYLNSLNYKFLWYFETAIDGDAIFSEAEGGEGYFEKNLGKRGTILLRRQCYTELGSGKSEEIARRVVWNYFELSFILYVHHCSNNCNHFYNLVLIIIIVAIIQWSIYDSWVSQRISYPENCENFQTPFRILKTSINHIKTSVHPKNYINID